MTSQTEILTSRNDSTTEKMHKLDPGTELSEITPQIGSECQDNEQGALDTVLTSSGINEKSNQVTDNVTENSVIQLSVPPQHDIGKSSPTGEGLHLQQSTIEQVSIHLSNENSKNNGQPFVQNVPVEPVVVSDAVTGLEKSSQTGEGLHLQQRTIEKVSIHLSNENSENNCQPFVQNVPVEPVVASDAGFSGEDQTKSVPAQVNISSVNEALDPPSEDAVKNISSDCVGSTSKSTTPIRSRHKGKGSTKLLKKKYVLRSSGSSDRTLRSRTQEKPKAPESNSNLVDVNHDGMQRKREKKKKKRSGEGIPDEFSRIKARLRYLLNRINYEQSLIDAYSGEGWKGYSMDKLKPEKELQRAKSEILRRKLKIRDLFRNLDSLCGEGRLPEAVFDSEGEIDSEDIFCAKCGSKELGTDNDIILCDGACDRGFHQLCLDPPLLTENIPPGDEGWLCPGCDCKDDCMDLVNDSLGTNLSLSDTWERVFPEAAGNNADHNLGLPSDDSDDDDYNPNAQEDADVEGGESSSDESKYASASEKLEDSHQEDQFMGLPSEDSEDDDYDPNGPDIDSRVTEESSSSDFTSDSEDLAATVKENMHPGQDEDVVSPSLDDVKNFKGSSSKKCKVGNGKKPSLADELSSLLETDPSQEGLGKRNVERLDYKKLYDEAYQSDTTSDDEDWTATATPSRKKKLAGKVTPGSPNGKSLHNSNNSTNTPRRNICRNKVENSNDSPTKSLDGPGKSGSMDKKTKSSPPKRLGEAVVQSLYESFKENQYPDKTKKESLAQQLGITIRQVAKWFENTRWSFRHSSHAETSRGRNALGQTTPSKAENQGALVGEEKDPKFVSQECSGQKPQKPKTPSSRKRKHLSEPQESEAVPEVDSTATMPPTCSPKAHEVETGHKMKTRKRK